MNEKIIVTSGNRYIDIDAYASCIAYANFLRLKGKDAIAVSTANLNESVTNSLFDLPEKLETNYKLTGEEKFIVLDVSNKDFFDNIVKEDKIIEILDHHYGYEEYWKQKLNENSHIESLGSIATFIYEIYEKENMLDQISVGMAKLLLAAILDNTLNLKAKITTERDYYAYEQLLKISNIGSDFAKIYFKECQEKIFEDIEESIKNDTKIGGEGRILPDVFGQLLLWNAKDILNNDTVHKVLNEFDIEWMMNIISLEDGISYIISENEKVKKNLEELFSNKFDKNIMKLDQIWLRKEIIKEALEKELDK